MGPLMDSLPRQTEEIQRLRQREVLFCRLHPDPRQAHSASLVLTGVEGIEGATPLTPHSLQISYRLDIVAYIDIEHTLLDLGFHLDNSLLNKIKRALIHYTEETARANLGCERGRGNCTRDVFVNRYQRLEHGCRDPRPEPWRHYR